MDDQEEISIVDEETGEQLQAVETDPRFEHALAHISENGYSRESIEKVKSKLLETKPIFSPFNQADFIKPAPPEKDHSKSVALNSGALNISLEVNMFETTRAEREFLFDLIERVQQFEEKRQNDD